MLMNVSQTLKRRVPKKIKQHCIFHNIIWRFDGNIFKKQETWQGSPKDNAIFISYMVWCHEASAYKTGSLTWQSDGECHLIKGYRKITPFKTLGYNSDMLRYSAASTSDASISRDKYLHKAVRRTMPICFHAWSDMLRHVCTRQIVW